MQATNRTARPPARPRHGDRRPEPSANGRPHGPDPAPSADGSDGRGADGRFTAGNRHGHGNAFARQVAERRKSLLAAVGPEDVAAVGRKLLAQALAGDVAAAKVLLAHVCGKPLPAVDPDRLDLHELGLLMESPDIADIAVIRGRVDPALAAEKLRRAEAATAEEFVAALRERVREMRDADLDMFLATMDEAEALGLDDDEDDGEDGGKRP